jgi:hypothetical protein
MLALEDEITTWNLICSEPISSVFLLPSFFCPSRKKHAATLLPQCPEDTEDCCTATWKLLHESFHRTHLRHTTYLTGEKKMCQLVCLLMLVEAHFWDHEKDMPIVQLTKCAPLNLYLFVHLDTAEKTLHCHLVSQWKTSRVYQRRYSGRRYHVDN